MDTTFAFWPGDCNRTFPQYTCQWHPCADVSPRVPVPVVHSCGSQAMQRSMAGLHKRNEDVGGSNHVVVGGKEIGEDSDRRSGSSDVGEPSSSDSSTTSSGAFEWPPYSHPRWEAHRQNSRGGWNVGQSNPSLCPCEQSAAKRPHNDDGQGGRLRHSWDALWGPPDQHVSRRGAQAARVSDKGGAPQASGAEDSLAPGWQRDLGCLAQWAREAASQTSRHPAAGMIPEPPLSPSHSLRSPRVVRQSASLTGGHKRSFSRAPAHSPVGEAPSSGPSYRSPRARRQAARLSEPGQPHKHNPGVETRPADSRSECCALCHDVLDLNRALYRTDCGVLCHLQCVRAERNQLPIMCRFCGQADHWLASSPHRPEQVGVH